MSKKYFVVRNVSGVNDGVQVATASIPATSPALFTSGDVTTGNWYLYKVPEGGTPPTGAKVQELTVEDARIAAQSELFSDVGITTEFIAEEQRVAQLLRAQFMVAQAALPVADAEALFQGSGVNLTYPVSREPEPSLLPVQQLGGRSGNQRCLQPPLRGLLL